MSARRPTCCRGCCPRGGSSSCAMPPSTGSTARCSRAATACSSVRARVSRPCRRSRRSTAGSSKRASTAGPSSWPSEGASSPTSPDSPLRPTCAVCRSDSCPRPCWGRSTQPSAARTASTSTATRTWPGLSPSRASSSATPPCSGHCPTANSAPGSPRWSKPPSSRMPGSSRGWRARRSAPCAPTPTCFPTRFRLRFVSRRASSSATNAKQANGASST